MPARKSNPPAARSENRRQPLLEAAARRFLRDGYTAASMRGIAADVGMQVGSIYYHFPSKADLLAAVHTEGLRRITAAVQEALRDDAAPWERLEAACAAHLTVVLEGGDFFQAIMREMPRQPNPAWRRVVVLRDEYENIFVSLLEALPLAAPEDRHDLRLMLLGSMNYAHTWYKPGMKGPAVIAANFVRFLRQALHSEGARQAASSRSHPRPGGGQKRKP